MMDAVGERPSIEAADVTDTWYGANSLQARPIRHEHVSTEKKNDYLFNLLNPYPLLDGVAIDLLR